MIVAHHASARRFIERKYPGAILWPVRSVLATGLRIRSMIAVRRLPKSDRPPRLPIREDDIMKVLVTGGAGFIGSNFVRRTLEDAYPGLEGAEVLVYDALTYSGNLANLATVADSDRFSFVQADIRDNRRAG